MSLMHHCDRCDAVAAPKRLHTTRQDEPSTTIPEHWRHTTIRDESDKSTLVAGSRRVVLCRECDRDLMAWFEQSGPHAPRLGA